MRRFRKILYVHEENSPTAIETLQPVLKIAGNSGSGGQLGWGGYC